ncbi:pilin N-terminal domain-containing protein [uncultured Enterococcus sp.]|uniref:pilin N-terminal domain-containing protein n=1 Tax=uncultured Enterococcus sp. TaxID=167972 RepID=UPI00258369A8|nr:pilin N-terminal domain-containing protein [uncultured Enterococcus sp.]
MKKLSLICLVIVYFFYGNSAFASEAAVSVSIDTKRAGEFVAGTEALTFDVYDLTEWCQKNNQSEKKSKQFWLDQYQNKQQFQRVIQQAALTKVNERPLAVGSDGLMQAALPYHQQGKPAVYLFSAFGETGNQEFLPLVLFLPTECPAATVYLYGKYQTTAGTEELIEESPNHENKPSTKTSLPQTNERPSNFLYSGILLALAGGGGLAYQKQKNRRKNE